jgi:excinuclease ABC subunit C
MLTTNLESLPSEPGVYLMKGANGQVLYVGKANHLARRVKQYFNPGRDDREMIPYLIKSVHSIETIITPSEKEALLLENTLIKKYQPKYNVLLKDDKTFVSLLVTTEDQFPTIKLIRSQENPGIHFGPYTSAHSARETLEIMQRLFPLRQCSDFELTHRKRPCLLYDIKRCLAPCVSKCTEEIYQKEVEKAIRFLKGQDRSALKHLKEEVKKASELLEFERAGTLHASIKMIEKVIEEQSALVDSSISDQDVFHFLRTGDSVQIIQLPFREGKLVGMNTFSIKQSPQEDKELWESFLLQQSELAPRILLPIELPNKTSLEELLSIKIEVPTKGRGLKLLLMAAQNLASHSNREDVLLDMQETLKLNRCPTRIECFDTSNISGTDPVASLISYVEGVYEKKYTRLFKIRGKGDDYAALGEVLLRHYQKAKEQNTLPDLCILDGGKGQLGVAEKIFKDLNIATVDLISVAKDEAKHTKGMTNEQIFLLKSPEPIHLPPHSALLLLLQRIRDEAHRAAIVFHRHRRSKRSFHSQLDEIPGIGPKKRKALLSHFGSVNKIKEATPEELKAIKELNQTDRETLYRYFNGAPD